MECREVREAASGSPRFLIMGQGNVKLTSTNVHFDSATWTLHADLTVQNLRTAAIGTRDGTTITGVRAFFHEGPKVTSFIAGADTGSVVMSNADGYGDFTRPHQPFYLYSQILQPNQVSAIKRWDFKSSSTVNTFSFMLYVLAYYAGESVVPAVAPDSVPLSVYDSTKIVWNDSVLSGPLYRNLLAIGFKAAATSEERLAAVNWINGRVVGGRPSGNGDGAYVVSLNDGGTTTALRNALARLDSLVQVEVASPEYAVGPDGYDAHVFPQDDPLLNAVQWRVDPDSAAGFNWATEAVDAPRAWGCTTGDPETPIAIVDHGFHGHTDLAASQPQVIPTPSDGTIHGLEVASVIASTGNNGSGVAGMMWKAKLSYYEITTLSILGWRTPAGSVFNNLARAINSGARVINMSLQTPYFDSNGNRRMPDGRFSDRYRAARDAKWMSWVISGNVRFGLDPLIVVSSGNYSSDVSTNGFARAEESHTDRVLVVGAIENAGYGYGDFGGAFKRSLWPHGSLVFGSNYGAAVQIAAPGSSVPVLSNLPSVGYTLEDGTSFSAPMVTGTAGLMLSLDPTLTAAELKQLLLEGAATGGRRVQNGSGSVDVLDAYESLKAVAHRANAGLCGNPVWKNPTGAVYAGRGPGWAFDGYLFTDGGTGMSVQHQSRRVRFSSGSAWSFAANAWTAGTDASPADNATIFSKQGKSHNGDTVFTVTKHPDPQSPQFYEIFLVTMSYPGGSAIVDSVRGPQINTGGSAKPYRCTAWPTSGTEWTDCADSARNQPDLRSTRMNVAYSSARQEVVLTISRDSTAWTVDLAPYVYGGFYVRNSAFQLKAMDAVQWFIPILHPEAKQSAFFAGMRIDNVGWSEDGHRLLAREVLFSTITSNTPTGSTTNSAVACSVVFRTATLPFLPEFVRTPGAYNSGTNCYPEASFAN
jgi:hypothetical protein